MTESLKMQTVIDKALAEVGQKESPAGSNKTKYGKWYGFDGYAWCAQFVSWCFNEAGFPLGHIDDDKGYRDCKSAYNFWKKNNQLTTAPKPGDIVLFSWKKDGKMNHTGIFYKHNTDGTFLSIEGNTSIGNDSDGGEVMIRKRSYSVAVFAHPAIYTKI